MTTIDDEGGPVHPVKVGPLAEDMMIFGVDAKKGEVHSWPGITLRDHFAGLAMTGLCSVGPTWVGVPDDGEYDVCAIKAYRIADSMLRAREGK